MSDKDTTRRPPEGDQNSITPQTTSSRTEIIFRPPPAVREHKNVWSVEIKSSINRTTRILAIVATYPVGVTMFSDELPGMFGDEPDVSCQFGGTSAWCIRFLRGGRRMGFNIALPNDIDLSDPMMGQRVSIVWVGARPGHKNALEFRIGMKKEEAR